jgi:hypothetical protein
MRKDFIPTNCCEAAKNFGISLVSSTQLFRALVDLQEGKFDRQEFWDALLTTDGVCVLPDVT